MLSHVSSNPLPALACVIITGGIHAGIDEDNCIVLVIDAASCPAPDLSDLFTKYKSAISINPAFRVCTASPDSGTNATTMESAAPIILTSV